MSTILKTRAVFPAFFLPSRTTSMSPSLGHSILSRIGETQLTEYSNSGRIYRSVTFATKYRYKSGTRKAPYRRAIIIYAADVTIFRAAEAESRLEKERR